MKNIITELFMSEYFLFQATLGKFLDADKELFDSLGKIYFLNEEKLEELYSLTHSAEVNNVATESDFMQRQRIKKYSELTGTELIRSSACDEILNVKGNAISLAHNARLKTDAEASQSVLYSTLSSAANSGSVHALRMLGVLQCEGIFVDKNERAGIKNIAKAADWNDANALLALLHYRKDTREYNISRLHMAVRDTPYAALYDEAVKTYFIDVVDEIREVKLLEKAFRSGVLKRDSYDPKYARIINCKALHFKDKERVIFTESKEVSAIAELPLKLSDGNSPQVFLPKLSDVHLLRENEREMILRNLRNSDLRGLSSYRPLCLCSDSPYILDMYADAFMKRMRGVHVERIDVSDLTDYDLEPNPSNVFVRSADEDKDNYYLLFLRGDITEKSAAAVKNFLQSGKRAKFHLNSPCATIDLGGVLPVIFSDKNNLKTVRQYCDVLQLKDVSADEMSVALGDMLERKKKLFHLADVKLTDDARDVIVSCGIDAAESIVDSAIRFHGVKGGTVVLDKNSVEPFLAVDLSNRIGFGFGGD